MTEELKEAVIELLEGILQGDGDIETRMASSHKEAGDPYPQPLQGFVNEAYKAFDKSPKMSATERKKFIDNAVMELNRRSFQVEADVEE